mmetsp:Transcript_25413/g.39906  ORF Transcript_25413/g.39906 Transcript_25413/m.39906 type:complete len:95 (+) Transcript_25413:190-474(+)
MEGVRLVALVSRDDIVSRVRANGGARKKPSRSVVDGELLWERLKNEVNDLGDDRLTPKGGNDGSGEGRCLGRCTRLVFVLGGAGGHSKSTERHS